MKTGSCLCGAVRFEVACDLPPPDACHCTDCRKHSGHVHVADKGDYYDLDDGLPQKR